MNRFLVKLNNTNNIQDLLQELYDLANNNEKQIQTEFDKIANTTTVNELDMDGKEKYGKTIAKYIELRQKCIEQKMNIARLMSEIYKNNGNVKAAIENSKDTLKSIDFKAMRAMADSKKNSMMGNDDDNGIRQEKYDIGKR